jgi:myo-inositol-1(or 4)-monophosphatase
VIATPLELRDVAITAARAGAAIVGARLRGVVSLAAKSTPTDVVTQTDIDTERAIRTLLLAATPDAGIIGEEDGATNPNASIQWIIDPLDGTVNYLYGLPVVAVSIAASINGEIVAGAVADVLRGEVFAAALGHGAERDGEPIVAVIPSATSMALFATGFSYRSDLRAQQGLVVQRLLPVVRDIRCFGSAALQLCWVGCGRVNAYFERDTKIWDYSAGALIAAEAGACVELPCPENDSLVFAAARAVFDDVRSLLD